MAGLTVATPARAGARGRRAPTVIYNDTCPICAREIAAYARSAERSGADLGFAGLSAAARYGLTQADAARQFHVLQDGRLHAGLDAFLIVNEIEGHEGNRYSQMWMWSGDPVDPAEPIALPDIINLNNVESVDSILIDGQPRLLIMSDEGNADKNEPAKYMMLDYEQLR